MLLSYVIKNDTTNDFPLEAGEAWKFVVRVEDEDDAYNQLEKVKMSSGDYGHTIMNVYLDGRPFDARSYWTEGANADDFAYDDMVHIHQTQDETKARC